MLPGGSRTICITWHTFPGWDLYSTCTDPAEHLTTAASGSIVDDIDAIDDLDRDLSEVLFVVNHFAAVFFQPHTSSHLGEIIICFAEICCQQDD